MLDNPFVIVTCAYNASDYIEDCIQSCIDQNGDIGHIVIDDCSEDNTYALAKRYEDKNRLVISTKKRSRTPALLQRNAVKDLVKNPDALIGIVDGDDKLLPDAVATVLGEIGDNWMFCSNYIYGLGSPYTKIYIRKSKVVDFSKKVRDQKFNFHHFHGFKKRLSDRVNPKDFYKKDGSLMGAGSDIPYMYAMLEMSGPDKVKYIDKELYYYNCLNPINDHKVNLREQYDAFKLQRGIDPYVKIEML